MTANDEFERCGECGVWMGQIHLSGCSEGPTKRVEDCAVEKLAQAVQELEPLPDLSEREMQHRLFLDAHPPLSFAYDSPMGKAQIGPILNDEKPFRDFAERTRPDDNPKSAFGIKKPALCLIPSPPLILVARAMELGATKYGPYNWRKKGVASSIYLDAAERHLRAYLDGEDNEEESGVSHLAHVIACCCIILDAEAIGKLIDDRPTPAPTAELIKKLTRV